MCLGDVPLGSPVQHLHHGAPPLRSGNPRTSLKKLHNKNDSLNFYYKKKNKERKKIKEKIERKIMGEKKYEEKMRKKCKKN